MTVRLYYKDTLFSTIRQCNLMLYKRLRDGFGSDAHVRIEVSDD